MAITPGFDISSHQQSTPDLSRVEFVVVRAGYGTDHVDVRYDYHSSNVRKAGLVLGSYWFWYDGQDNAQAVKTFWETSKDADFWVIDLEGINANTDSGRAQVRDFIKRFKALTGKQIGLYHSLSGFPYLGQDYNWVALWASVKPGIPWRFWQYTNRYSGLKLDADYFNGSKADLLRFVGMLPPETSTEEDLTPDIRKLEDWKAANGNGVLRTRPVRADVPFTRLADGTIVTSVGELKTADGNNWRMIAWDLGYAWILRTDFEPLVQGGDPSRDADFEAVLARVSRYDMGYADGKIAGMSEGKQVGYDAGRTAAAKAIAALPADL